MVLALVDPPFLFLVSCESDVTEQISLSGSFSLLTLHESSQYKGGGGWRREKEPLRANAAVFNR